MTADLVAFLRARLDEDERIARNASGNSPWRAEVHHGLDRVEGDGWTVCSADQDEVVHIARHDPARVLRDIAFKRDMLRTAANPWEQVPSLLTFIRNLAAVYDDHPDYRPEWRPQ